MYVKLIRHYHSERVCVLSEEEQKTFFLPRSFLHSCRAACSVRLDGWPVTLAIKTLTNLFPPSQYEKRNLFCVTHKKRHPSLQFSLHSYSAMHFLK